jgi:hypothetical protein
MTAHRSLTDAQRSRPVSSERTQLVELRALGSIGSSAEGALSDGPEPDEFADFGSALLTDRRAFRPSGLFVADGGSECRVGPCCAAGSARSRGRPGVLLPVEVGPGFPWGSLVFPRVPSCSLVFPRVPYLFLRGVCWGAGVERRPPKRGIRAGQRPAALVGVTGFEPAASSSRTGDHSALPCH